MGEEAFLLVSLKDDHSKKLAQVISNETSRKILDYLIKKEATESEIAEGLSIPLSTVHYNMTQLVKSKLVSADEYHYSPKGKEVNHYRLANKLIVIAPTGIDKVKDMLKSFFPIAFISAGAAAVIHLLQSRVSSLGAAKAIDAAIAPAPMMAARSMDVVEEAVAMGSGAAPMPEAITVTPEISIAAWFLFGALFAILLFLLWEFIRRKLVK
ncbi:MAG: helix-turn-helix domain-containing protein [archaeon]